MSMAWIISLNIFFLFGEVQKLGNDLKKKENKKMESLHPESIFIVEERDRKDLKRSPT